MTVLEQTSIAVNDALKPAQTSIDPLLHAQRRRLRSLGIALKKWLGQWLASPKRPQRDRRNIGRLYLGWFGGFQFFYSRENEP